MKVWSFPHALMLKHYGTVVCLKILSDYKHIPFRCFAMDEVEVKQELIAPVIEVKQEPPTEIEFKSEDTHHHKVIKHKESSACGFAVPKRRYNTRAKIYPGQNVRPIVHYNCTSCRGKFSDRNDVWEHFRTFKPKQECGLIVERSYTCDYCVYTHKRCGAYTAHRQDGTCGECGKRFPFTRDLMVHLKGHEIERNSCVLCCLHFGDSRLLQEHEREFHRKPICMECGTPFPTEQSCKHHMKKKHGK